MWSSPAGDLLLAAGQVSCVAASLYSVSAEPGLHRLTENTLDTYGLSARLTAHTNTKRNRSPLSGPLFTFIHRWASCGSETSSTVALYSLKINLINHSFE